MPIEGVVDFAVCANQFLAFFASACLIVVCVCVREVCLRVFFLLSVCGDLRALEQGGWLKWWLWCG